MSELKHRSKLIIYPVLYWVILIILPFISTYIVDNIECCDYYTSSIMIYIFFIAPFLFVIPYKLAMPATKQEKIILVIMGLVVPFLLLYIYALVDFYKYFNPSF